MVPFPNSKRYAHMIPGVKSTANCYGSQSLYDTVTNTSCGLSFTTLPMNLMENSICISMCFFSLPEG